MLLKVVFVITLNKTLMKHIQNKQNPYQLMDIKNLEKKIHVPKVLRLFPNVCDLQKENHILGYGF
jgi:hypothetical protein